MEKIKLNNKQTFDIIPMGIGTNKYEKKRFFSFIADLGYSDIENAFNKANISKIDYYSSVGELLKTYTDCISLKVLSKELDKEYEDGKFADIYTVKLEIP